jgi:hypothetical protein
MLRHEYADHVAALVFATMLRENEIRQRTGLGYADNYVLAEEASRAAEALAAVRYPEAREGVAPCACNGAGCPDRVHP